MTNKELDQKICKAFEEVTPNVLGSVLADCARQPKPEMQYSNVMASWGKKFTLTVATAALVIFLSLGLGGFVNLGPLAHIFQTNPQEMVIQYSAESCLAIEDNCFYAVGEDGALYRVLWNDTDDLYEGQLVEVSYDSVQKLEYPEGYPSGWSPQYEVTAVSVDTYGETIHRQGDGIVCIYGETIGQIKDGISYVTDINGVIWKILVSDHTQLDLSDLQTKYGWIYLNGVTKLDEQENGALFQAASVRIKFSGAEFEEDLSLHPEFTNDVVRMDFDGDGNEEICILAHGRTSGLMTKQITIYNLDGSIKYDSTFVVHYNMYDTAFYVNDGKLYVIGCCDSSYNLNTSLVSGWRYLTIQVALVDGQLKLLESSGAEWGKEWGPSDEKPVDPDPADPIDPWPSVPEVTEPAEPKPTEPIPGEDGPTMEFPVDLITDTDTVSKFQAMFSCKHPEDNYYNMALLSVYAEPSDVDLKDLFYNGFANDPQPTNAEKEALKEYTQDGEVAIIRISADRMNAVLMELFGLTLADFDQDALKKFAFLESTNCYYLFHNDGLCAHDVQIAGIRNLENGSIEVYYSWNSWTDMNGVITLQPNGDSYQVLSNIFTRAPK